MNRPWPYLGVTDWSGDIRILSVTVREHSCSVRDKRLGQHQAHVTIPLNGEAVITCEYRQDGTDYGLCINK